MFIQNKDHGLQHLLEHSINSTDPRRMWSFLESIGTVTQPLAGNEREGGHPSPFPSIGACFKLFVDPLRRVGLNSPNPALVVAVSAVSSECVYLIWHGRSWIVNDDIGINQPDK